MSSQEAEAFGFFFKKHLSKVTMAKAYFTGISNGTGNTESLKSFADCCSCVSCSLTALLNCNCSAYNVSPASIFKADRLDFLNLVIYVKSSVFCDFFSFFKGSDAVAVQYGIDFINTSFL